MTSRYFIALVSADLLGEGEKTLAESVAKVLDSKRETLHGHNLKPTMVARNERRRPLKSGWPSTPSLAGHDSHLGPVRNRELTHNLADVDLYS